MTDSNKFDITSPWGPEIIVTVRGASETGGLPMGVMDYILSGERFDCLTLRADDLTDYSFLVDNREKITALNLHCENVDWVAISQLTNVMVMDIAGGYPSCPLDFKKLTSLTRLYVEWNGSYENTLKNLKGLKSLSISNFKLGSLESLGNMTSLEYLGVTHSKKMVSLDGIEKFKKLRVLHLEANGQLIDIQQVASCKNLEFLFLNKNKKLYDYSPIGQLRKLDELVLVGGSDAVDWLQGVISLTHLRMDCKLGDANLDFLYDMESLQYVRLKDKKGQSVKSREIQRHLEGKGYDQKALELGVVPSHSSDYG
jgi:Leucine-rich repeat (LRR) protein